MANAGWASVDAGARVLRGEGVVAPEVTAPRRTICPLWIYKLWVEGEDDPVAAFRAVRADRSRDLVEIDDRREKKVMPYAAISYRVKEGYEDDLARLFSNIGRVSSPVLHDESGKEVGMLLGTAVFIEGPMIVRFIHYSGGTLEDVARHMSHQPAVHNFEEALQPYLAEERDTTTPEAFREFFTKSTMRCLTQASLESWKAEAAGAQPESE